MLHSVNICEWKLEMVKKAYFEVFFQHLPEVTEEKHETSGLQTNNQSSNLQI
jgi:hypothetical protein